MFGPFGDPRVAAGISAILGSASARVEEVRQRSMKRAEDGGTSERGETSDTDDLIDVFDLGIKEGIHNLGDSLKSSGIDLRVRFSTANVLSEETENGADFGVRIHLEGPDYEINKAVLFQCKRMYGPSDRPTYRELRGRGELQAERMLSITPASFFLFFNGVPTSTVSQWVKPPIHLFPWYRPYERGPYTLAHFERYYPELGFPFLAWNTGMMVLPASRVLAESKARKAKGGLIPLDCQHWMQGALPFAVFMTDLLGSCAVGDVRESVLRLVTPPLHRELSKQGVADFEPSPPPVERIMDIHIESGQAQP